MESPERTRIFVAIIVVVTIVAAIAMLPNTEEKAQVLLSQGRVEEAMELYETKRETAQLNPFEAYSLAGLYLAHGRNGPLTHLLEDEIAIRPQSDWARPMLVERYRADRSYGNEARILTQIFARTPTAADYRRLIALYRLEGDRIGERATIELGRANGLASEHDLARLERLKSTPVLDGIAQWHSSEPVDIPSEQETPR
ncbi:hypothetical protein KKY_2562 [Pelagibacterium halotolerans B2]|uniref:Uncharacterized protein n=2 Tax=Pelagibacterium TaxID=1082930 RepID=G4RAP7_PELHB|nr:hypothetical protein KKY_2562 [Pelagibacterium halotolerans B2]